jgi:uncharacterized protein YbjT (DUF2867 family)
MSIALIIGASGTVGWHVASQLAARGSKVRALVRNLDTVQLPPQVEAVRGDLTDPGSLDRCLDAIDRVFLVWTAPLDAAAPALERIAMHARRIVYLSAPLKTPHPFFQRAQPNPSTALHAHMERLIESSGLEWTLLRPGMFAANALRWWAPQIQTGAVVRWPYLHAPTAPVDERDIAAVAVYTLSGDGHSGAEYVLTGPESLSQFEQLSIIGSVIGRSLHIEEISPQDARREWNSLMPPWVVDMLLAAWAGGLGIPAHVTTTVGEITGAPARTFRDWVTDHAEAFYMQPRGL